MKKAALSKTDISCVPKEGEKTYKVDIKLIEVIREKPEN